MIRPGGPVFCGACRTLMHEPRPDCPEPFEGSPEDLDPFEVARRMTQL